MPGQQQGQRNEAIDLLRGLVMVIMVLDHARDFWGGFTPDPTDLQTTTVALFMTRWVTHICAPVFVFLAGISAYLYGRGRSPARLSRFLLSRGLWLVLIELTVCKYAWIPEPGYSMVLLGVIWAIGWSMIALAGLCFLGPWATGLVGLVIVVGHNAFDSVAPGGAAASAGLWMLLHESGELQLAGDITGLVAYPLLPWIGVMALGYSFGMAMALPAPQRIRLCLRLGVALTAAFFLLRGLNHYGDPAPRTVQPHAVFSALSFLNTSKYPPSLLYLLMTLGPALCLLALFESWTRGSLRSALLVFGRVPLFFYVLHLYLLRLTALPVSYALYGSAAFTPPPGPAGSVMLGLGVTYLAWAAAIVLLYPACRWFAAVKQRRRDWWLSYL